jgi:hypothetical protein|tara:strand:- start:374 stop:919 length:546 start_codon:yes stop_codon:yes gene_type:complete
MEIIDNFLPAEELLPIQSVMLGNAFPWFYNDYIAYDPDEKNMFVPPGKSDWNDFQFIHVFYHLNRQYGYQEICSAYMELIHPILHRLKMFCLLRCKANLTTGTPKENIPSGFHCDMEYDATTAVFYLNSNDGYTVFPDGKKVESVANRLVKFPTLKEHSGVSCSDNKRRIIINFNYIENMR